MTICDAAMPKVVDGMRESLSRRMRASVVDGDVYDRDYLPGQEWIELASVWTDARGHTSDRLEVYFDPSYGRLMVRDKHGSGSRGRGFILSIDSHELTGKPLDRDSLACVTTTDASGPRCWAPSEHLMWDILNHWGPCRVIPFCAAMLCRIIRTQRQATKKYRAGFLAGLKAGTDNCKVCGGHSGWWARERRKMRDALARRFRFGIARNLSSGESAFVNALRQTGIDDADEWLFRMDLDDTVPVGFVYALLSATNEVVYVGMTNNPGGRIKSHRKDKVFSRAVFLPVPHRQMRHIEAACIKRLSPKYNRCR